MILSHYDFVHYDFVHYDFVGTPNVYDVTSIKGELLQHLLLNEL